MSLDWQAVVERCRQEPNGKTKNGKPFKICRIVDNGIYIDLPAGEQYVSKEALEEAVKLIHERRLIKGPGDYRRLVKDERPSYAWAILRDLGFV